LPYVSSQLLYYLGVGTYECLTFLVGLCNSPDILRKISQVISGFEFAVSRSKIDNLLGVSKVNFENHLEHLEEVFTQSLGAELKFDATKSHFCRDELEYLEYLINRKG
jgi:hypothetical protein